MRKPPVSTKPRSRTQVNGSASPLGNKGAAPPPVVMLGRSRRPTTSHALTTRRPTTTKDTANLNRPRSKATPRSTTRSACTSCRWARSRCSTGQTKSPRPADRRDPQAASATCMLAQRLRAARRRRAAGKGADGRAAARPHDRSLGHQHGRKEADPQADLARTWPRSSTCCGRTRPTSASPISKRHAEAEKHARLAPPDRPPQQGRAAGRRAEPAHATPACRSWTSCTRSASGWSRSSSSSPSRNSSISGQQHARAAPRTPLPDADHARNARHAAPPHRPHRTLSQASTTPPSASCRPATCGWSSRSPSSIATAA